MSCCPPNAEKFLAANYATFGQTQTLAGGTEAYTSGNADKGLGVVLIPDVYGWNGGRTRAVADMLADGGYLAIVPKLMVPALDGGTDGEGLPPTFDFATEMPRFPPYVAQFPYEGNLDSKIEDAVAFLKSRGVNKIHVLGFCWGGWVMIHAFQGASAAHFTSGAIAHPSVHLEGFVWKKDANALFANSKKPILLMPAKGDPAEYHEDGAWFQSLKAVQPTSETVSFPEVNHGFVPRGDISDAHVKAEVERAIENVFRFFAAHN